MVCLISVFDILHIFSQNGMSFLGSIDIIVICYSKLQVQNENKVFYWGAFMNKIAHINGNQEQTIQEHLNNVGDKAAEFFKSYDIKNFDAYQYAYQTGLAHDIGKYSELFQHKIRDNLNINIDHSTAGAREMQRNKMLAAAFAIAGHHGGIPNGRDMTEQNLIVRENWSYIQIMKVKYP